MTLVIVLAMVILLDVAALRFGHDSRDSRDWTSRTG
jgi:hypothetical protein